MKNVAVAAILLILVAVVLWFGDNISYTSAGSLFNNPAALLILLLCIPLSLTLFFLLSQREQEKDSRHRQEDDSAR